MNSNDQRMYSYYFTFDTAGSGFDICIDKKRIGRVPTPNQALLHILSDYFNEEGYREEYMEYLQRYCKRNNYRLAVYVEFCGLYIKEAIEYESKRSKVV